jgi:hypothetical protein
MWYAPALLWPVVWAGPAKAGAASTMVATAVQAARVRKDNNIEIPLILWRAECPHIHGTVWRVSPMKFKLPRHFQAEEPALGRSWRGFDGINAI